VVAAVVLDVELELEETIGRAGCTVDEVMASGVGRPAAPLRVDVTVTVCVDTIMTVTLPSAPVSTTAEVPGAGVAPAMAAVIVPEEAKVDEVDAEVEVGSVADVMTSGVPN